MHDSRAQPSAQRCFAYGHEKGQRVSSKGGLWLRGRQCRAWSWRHAELFRAMTNRCCEAQMHPSSATAIALNRRPQDFSINLSMLLACRTPASSRARSASTSAQHSACALLRCCAFSMPLTTQSLRANGLSAASSISATSSHSLTSSASNSSYLP